MPDVRSSSLNTLVGGDKGSFAVFKDMLGESANAFGDVLLTESGGVEGYRSQRTWWTGVYGVAVIFVALRDFGIARPDALIFLYWFSGNHGVKVPSYRQGHGVVWDWSVAPLWLAYLLKYDEMTSDRFAGI